jgi:hypothetical protein
MFEEEQVVVFKFGFIGGFCFVLERSEIAFSCGEGGTA